MTYSIVDTSKWPLDRLAPYMSDVLREMGRLARRFPKDTNTEALFGEILTGKKTLWLILDGDAFVSMALTSIRTIDVTGTRLATLNDLAGRDAKSYAAELCSTLEQWATANNAVPEIFGRKGWEPLLKQFGYRPHAILYRKAV